MGFSANVRIRLYVDGRSVPVSQVGPASVRLRTPCSWIHGQPATLVITIGRTRKRQAIVLGECDADDPHEVGYRQ